MAKLPVITPTEEYVLFYQAIGVAITQWAHVEDALYRLTARAFNKSDSSTLAFGFFSIENFRSKLAFVDRTFPDIPDSSSHEPEWANIRDRISGLSSRRNQLAHGRVMNYLNDTPGRQTAIIPLFQKSPKKKPQKGPPPGSLCVKDIDLIQQQFFQATHQVLSLVDRIDGVEGPHAEFAQREPQHRTLAELRTLIDVVCRQRAQSSQA